jgi:hypothetical protein
MENLDTVVIFNTYCFMPLKVTQLNTLHVVDCTLLWGDLIIDKVKFMF